MKLKVLSSALSLIILCSAASVNAESIVAGQLVANPTAIVTAGEAKQKVASTAISYVEGDTITTQKNSDAKLSLTSGLANVVIAPETTMSVMDASNTNFSLVKGAFSIDAKAGQVVSIETAAGTYELTSASAVDAVVTFQNGEFAAVSKSGLLNVQTPNGVVTPIESGDAFVFNDAGATSVDVQAAGGDVHEHEKDGEYTSHAHDDGLTSHEHGAGYFTVNNGLIVGGIVIATALLSGTFSDGSDADDDVASPAQ